MRKSKVKKIWKEGGLALGTLIKSNDPVHSEIAGQMDFDFLWYDLEHSEKSVQSFANLCRATRVGSMDVLARPARWEYMRMGRIMEAGANGIMYPRCESVDEAREVIRFSKFFPLGERGFDGGNADNNFGQYKADDYTAKTNEETWITIQIESPAALPQVREIAEVEGVDCVFMGPGDFALMSGNPGQIKSEEVLKAAKQIADDTLAAGKVFGTMIFDMDHSKMMQDMGARMLVHSADIIYYKQALQKIPKDYGRA
ncbi:MAG: aldolase [Opitutaceae bacterium]|nr:aldolase [Opitutaceae bacterium]|tara:strand:+ start:788 stop:1555 length:768 start_codon:yes stop_codon:yes gene_type:complete